jgi:hypothetical protein
VSGTRNYEWQRSFWRVNVLEIARDGSIIIAGEGTPNGNTGLAEPSQLSGVSRYIRADGGGKPFAVSETFLKCFVVETYPLCSRAEFWHSASKHVSAQ